jgi:hypothetical protein
MAGRASTLTTGRAGVKQPNARARNSNLVAGCRSRTESPIATLLP